MFGDGEGEHADLSRAELEKAVEERKRERPAGIERQVRLLISDDRMRHAKNDGAKTIALSTCLKRPLYTVHRCT